MLFSVKKVFRYRFISLKLILNPAERYFFLFINRQYPHWPGMSEGKYFGPVSSHRLLKIQIFTKLDLQSDHP